MNHEHIHQHKRKRLHQYKEPFPHPNPKVKLLDDIVLVISIIFPITLIPQIIRIWYYKEVAGVSVLTWGLFFIFNTILLIYGIVHKEKKLVVMWSLFSIGYLLIVIGVLLFR